MTDMPNLPPNINPEILKRISQDPKMKALLIKKLQEMKKKAEVQKQSEENEENNQENPQTPEQKKVKGTKKDFKVLGEFLAKRDLRVIKTYSDTVVSKFGKYIKAIWIVGSSKTGKGFKKTSDIDIPIIVDDTDVKRMTRGELKEKLFQRMVEMGFQIDRRIHPQAYLLTEFWQYIREGNPVLMTMLRDGAIIYDTGFLLPIKMLLEKGLITPSKEATDKLMISSKELIKVTKDVILEKLSHNIHLAAVSAVQAVLMELGYRAPTPKMTPNFAEEILFKKFKYMTEEDVKICEHLVMTYKQVEHKELSEISGTELQKLIEEAELFVDKMEKLLKRLREEKGESYLYEIFEKKEEFEMKHDGMITSEKSGSIAEAKEEQLKKELGQR